MPNRVLRDWTASEKIDTLSEGAEVFFVRLIMKADDFGLYSANPKFLRSTLFPLKEISENKVLQWLEECRNAGIIRLYNHENKAYLEIINFDQRTRIKNAKYPTPDQCQTYDGQLTDICRPETKRNETETKPKLKEEKTRNFEEFSFWTESIIDGRDYIFTQKFNNEFPNWGGGAEKFVEIVKDHLDLLNRYEAMNPNTQERFRASVIKHFREFKQKSNGAGKPKGYDADAAMAHIFGQSR